MSRCDEPSLSWNEFQHQNRGKYSREDLSAQWKLYKESKSTRPTGGPLSKWLKKHQESRDTASEKDSRAGPSSDSAASSHLPRAAPPVPLTSPAQDKEAKGKHAGPIGKLFKALKKEARRLFSSSSQHQETQNYASDPAYQASLIAAAWAAEAERAAKEAQRLSKEETLSEISRNQGQTNPTPPGLPSRILRTVNRENLPHDHDIYYKHFSPWMEVSTGNLRSIRRSIPFQPGLYEWGCSAPGDNRIVAFYLGKAGTLKPVKKRGSGGVETIRSRFSHYSRGRVIGPVNEPFKEAVFADLQKRGFKLWFRFRTLSDVEPVNLETWI